MKYTKLIEKFLLGELEGDDLTYFLTQLKTNPELNFEYGYYQRVLRFVSENELEFGIIIKHLSSFEFEPEVFSDIMKFKTKEILKEDESELSEMLKKIRESSRKPPERDPIE